MRHFVFSLPFCLLVTFLTLVIDPLTHNGNAANTEQLKFVCVQGLIEQQIGEIVLPKIYQKLGIEISISALPGKRAQAMAVTGQRDGEIMRIFTYGENNPSVVRVPTPYYSLQTMGFVKKGRGIEIKSKKDLNNYRAAKVFGVKHTDNITNEMPDDQVADMSATLNILLAVVKGRVDVALTNSIDGLLSIEHHGFDDLVPLPEPLAVHSLYHYIHKNKAEIVSEIDAMIKKLKESGELAEMIKEAEKEVYSKYQK